MPTVNQEIHGIMVINWKKSLLNNMNSIFIFYFSLYLKFENFSNIRWLPNNVESNMENRINILPFGQWVMHSNNIRWNVIKGHFEWAQLLRPFRRFDPLCLWSRHFGMDRKDTSGRRKNGSAFCCVASRSYLWSLFIGRTLCQLHAG